MKRVRLASQLLLLLTLILFAECKKKIELPEITTSEIVNIETYQATGGGNITSDGNSEITARGIYWDYMEKPSISGHMTTDGTGVGAFSSTITGLEPGRKYYVQAYATNSLGTQYGQIVSFITGVSAPEIKDLSTSIVATTTAYIHGYVNPMSLVTIITFEYGLTTSYENSVPSIQDSLFASRFCNVNAYVKDLIPGSVYHFRIKAKNELGTTYSNDQTFTTPGWPPTVKNELLSDILMNSITVNSEATTGSLTTSIIIEYGTSENFGNSSFITAVSEGSWPIIEVKKVFDNLTPGTKYYFRIKVINPVATIYSNVLSCTTFNMMDIDHNLYHSIKIGSQEWFQENLRTIHFQNGDPIPVIPFDNDWVNILTIACTYYNYDLDLGKKYGYLYNYYVAGDIRNVCTDGWHVPTKAEWTTLVDFAGGDSVAAPKFRYHLPQAR